MMFEKMASRIFATRTLFSLQKYVKIPTSSKLLAYQANSHLLKKLNVNSMTSLITTKSFHTSWTLSKEESNEIDEDPNGEEAQAVNVYENISEDPKDRTRVISLETSMAYMESDAYRQTYGDHKVWELYRRNFSKGRHFAQTRKTCIRQDRISTGNPCPICRDEYLVVDYRNLKLITQFIDEYSGRVYSTRKTGVCQRQQLNLLVAIEKARELGLLTIDQPFVEYDYSKYNQILEV